MKDIKLIKELNEMIREKDEFERALEESGIEFDMGDGETEEFDDVNGERPAYGPDSVGSDEELERIADHWREEGAEMEDDELRGAIGDELEQLEYSPEEISDSIDRVMSMLGRGDDEMDDEMDDEYEEPDVDERQEHEDFEQSDEYFGGGDERM